MDRLFLDANILFSAAYRPASALAEFWKLKDVVLCTSHFALEEARMNLPESAQRRRLARLTRHIRLYDARPRQLPGDLCLPDKDVPILLAAIEARATHLITGDLRHFGPYFGKKVEGVLVLLPANYLRERHES